MAKYNVLIGSIYYDSYRLFRFKVSCDSVIDYPSFLVKEHRQVAFNSCAATFSVAVSNSRALK